MLGHTQDCWRYRTVYILNDLAEWSGKADCTAAPAHAEQSEQLRIKYGIKPKAKKQ